VGAMTTGLDQHGQELALKRVIFNDGNLHGCL
jgi:hypothetical protein